LFIVWEKDPHAREMRGWVPLFFAHLLLNAAWPMFFFGFHAIFIALIDILLLNIAVFLLIFGAYEIDKRAAFLLVPYQIWLVFAAVLNLTIWMAN
jgi:translocator protein